MDIKTIKLAGGINPYWASNDNIYNRALYIYIYMYLTCTHTTYKTAIFYSYAEKLWSVWRQTHSDVTDKNNNVSFECLIKTIMSVLNVLTDIITSITAHTIGFAFFLP